MGTPLYMKDASVRIVVPPGAIAGAAEYSCVVQVAEVLSAPGPRVDYPVLCPDGTLSQTGPSTYSVHLKGVQDWGTTGLSRFLWENAGAVARMVIQAHGTAAAFAPETPGFDCSVVLIEGSYGGEATKFAEYDCEFACTARPTLLETAPTTASAESKKAA